MKLSAAIMAHPDRSSEVAELTASLDRQIVTCWDDGGPPSGNGDRVWATARRAWMSFDPSADWHVIIQDDAIVSSDFLTGLEVATASVPAPAVISPYLGRGRNVPLRWGRMAEKANQLGASWIVSDRVMWGVCLALPVSVIPDVVAWCDRKAGMPDDMRIAAYAKRNGLDAWYPWPSLVDHRTVPSLTKHRATDRTAARFHAGSALGVDWSGRAIFDPMLSRRRGLRSGPHVR